MMNTNKLLQSPSGAVMDLRVSRLWPEADDIIGIELEAPSGSTLPCFEAGAHIDVFTPGGTVRQYSLFNDPADGVRYCIGVLREAAGRGGSRSLHEKLRTGDLLRVSYPRNMFRIGNASGKCILIAGGIGITPLLAMAQTLSRQGRDFALHYCTRSMQRTAFRTRISAADMAGRVNLHLDDGEASQKLDLDHLFQTAEHESHFYYCGPGGFMDAVARAGKAAGWPSAQMHCEYFSAPAATTAQSTPFVVKLARRGIEVPVGASESVVQALSRRGIFIPTSCEQGVCGSCITTVLEGTPDHRDSVLSDMERGRNDLFTPCCSRAKSATLVLDL